MEMTLVKNLMDLMKDEKIDMKLREISDFEFWIEEPYGFLSARFFMDVGAREISYDVFSPKYRFTSEGGKP